MAEERSSALPGILGCLTGLGCGLVLLIGCVTTFWMLSRSGSASVDPVPTPPPYYPPPSGVPPIPPTLPPPPVIPPAIPPAPPGTLAPPGDLAPRLVHATVTEVTGSIEVSVGASCDFNVERRDQMDGSFVCNAQVVCGGRLLYGGPEAGYFPCTLYEGPPRHVVGADTNTTSIDNDGAMSLDTHGTLEIWDDASGPNHEFRVRARVESVE